MNIRTCILMAAGLVFTACASKPVTEGLSTEVDLPTLSLTLWSTKTELFLEYPPLVQGGQAAFAVHLTDLATFLPLPEGKVTLELESDGKVERFEGMTPSRPGIFHLEATLGKAGTYRATLRVTASKLEDLHHLGELIVYEHQGAAMERARGSKDQEEIIRFLKEQQWSSEFATEVAAPRRIQDSIVFPAVVKPRGGGEGSVISPVRGRLLKSPIPPAQGQKVRAGEVVASVSPFTSAPQDQAALQLDLAQAETDLAQTLQQRARLEGLLAERAIPARRIEEGKAEEAKARARVEAARARLSQFDRTRTGTVEDTSATSFQVRAPLDGIVTALSAVTGGAVEAGQEILHIMNIDRVWVTAEVPEVQAGILRGRPTAELEIPGTPRGISVPGARGKILRIGSFVDPESRRIPVIIDVFNEDGLLRIGQSLSVRLGIGEAAERVCVPSSALVDDGGRPVVMVQLAGESFQRRAVRTGSAGLGYVQILEGLQPGERVVSKGAYLIRLAALSTQIPAHGHVH